MRKAIEAAKGEGYIETDKRSMVYTHRDSILSNWVLKHKSIRDLKREFWAIKAREGPSQPRPASPGYGPLEEQINEFVHDEYKKQLARKKVMDDKARKLRRELGWMCHSTSAGLTSAAAPSFRPSTRPSAGLLAASSGYPSARPYTGLSPTANQSPSTGTRLPAITRGLRSSGSSTDSSGLHSGNSRGSHHGSQPSSHDGEQFPSKNERRRRHHHY